MGFAEALEEAAGEALGRGLGVLHQRRQLEMVPHQAEAAGEHQTAQHRRDSDLPGLVHYAHIKGAPHQQRMTHSQACAAHLSQDKTSVSNET